METTDESKKGLPSMTAKKLDTIEYDMVKDLEETIARNAKQAERDPQFRALINQVQALGKKLRVPGQSMTDAFIERRRVDTAEEAQE